MKIVNAEWEKRNLDKNTLEIEIGKDDRFDDIVKILDNDEIDYFVIKLPTYRFDLICPIQDLGFRFIEILNFSKINTIKKPSLNNIQKRFLTQITYSDMSSKQKLILEKNIKKNLFDSDRISIDPSFCDGISAKRYMGLIEDEQKNGAKLFSLNYKKVGVGFFIIKNQETYSISNLAGIYKDFQKLGLGFFLNYLIIEECRKRGKKTLKTAYSSNNYGAFNIHKSLGFEEYKRLTIFTKNSK